MMKSKMTHHRARLFSNAGFSLVEITVVMGILAISGTAAMQFIHYTTRGTVEMQTRVAVQDLLEDLRAMLGFAEICTTNFQTLSLNSPQTITEVRTPAPNNVVRYTTAASGVYENNTLRVLRMELRENAATPLTGTTGVADLMITLRKLKDTGTVAEITRRVPIRVTIDNLANKGIVGCVAESSVPTDARTSCESMGGRFIEGATVENNRCFLQEAIISDDPNLDPAADDAMLHVRKGTTDLFAVTPTGDVGVGYPVATIPTSLGTKLYVNGDQRISGNIHARRKLATRLVLSEDVSALYSDPWLLNPQSAFVSKVEPDGQEYYGFLAENGDFFLEGGNDGVMGLSQTSTQLPRTWYYGGISVYWAPDAARYPLPKDVDPETPLFTIRNDGRTGIGYTSRMAEKFPIHPPTCPLPPGDEWPALDPTHKQPQWPQFCRAGDMAYSGVKFFVRDGAWVDGHLYVGGHIYAGAGGVGPPSDRRWKKKIKTLEGALPAVEAVEGVTYAWKRDPDGKRDVGFIAQEVEKHFPQAIYTDPKGYKYLRYSKLIPVLWQAFRDYLPRVERLEARVDRLEKLLCEENRSDVLCAEGTEGGLE